MPMDVTASSPNWALRVDALRKHELQPLYARAADRFAALAVTALGDAAAERFADAPFDLTADTFGRTRANPQDRRPFADVFVSPDAEDFFEPLVEGGMQHDVLRPAGDMGPDYGREEYVAAISAQPNTAWVHSHDGDWFLIEHVEGGTQFDSVLLPEVYQEAIFPFTSIVREAVEAALASEDRLKDQ